ncbi:MAG: riboflavin biosynthesis protein RibD [Zetaproteobacteria bacterium]|nr:riboflavin biosynthesis protein RibD [Pseudobdellovibrionaceae bacterium]
MLQYREPLDDIYQNFLCPPVGTKLSAKEAMSIAISKALEGVGYVETNPLVGAVAVDKNHCFIAAGAHLKNGSSHAEANLLKVIEEQNQVHLLRGATIYVTLEPCAHKGRTSSCAKTLASLPISKLVYGLVDPDPRVNGKGINIIEQAGIKVSPCSYKDPLLGRLIEVFSWVKTTSMPFVSMKAATTLNGVIARQGDQRCWITGERARSYGHWLRLFYDAILVGPKTIAFDNPRLDVRFLPQKHRVPWRVVYDPDAQALLSRDFKGHDLFKVSPEKLIWCCHHKVWRRLSKDIMFFLESLGVSCFSLLSFNHHENYLQILQELAKRGCASLLLEGGAFIWGSFLNFKLVNRAHLFQAPIIFGNGERVYWDSSLQISQLELKDLEWTPLDKDFLIEGRVTNSI